MSQTTMPTLYQWKKACSAHRAEEWLVKLASSVPADRLAVVSPVKGKTQSLQAYLDSEREALELVRRFGGRVSNVEEADWLPSPSSEPDKPLSFGPSLLVTGRPEELSILRARYPRKHILAIPAAMAFGTGEHATTAMCLRFLSELGRRHQSGEPWTLLDLGCGSGVLALAARFFGARSAEGWDHDPHAVRTAKENVSLNGVNRVRIRRVDLLRGKWPSTTPNLWPIVAANLFSELLISALPKTASILREGGFLVASGVLASQASEVESAFADNGLRLITKRRRGRWLAYLVRKSSEPQS